MLAVPSVVTPPGGPVLRSGSSKEVVATDRILRLDQALSKEDVFTWEAPAGEWTVLRFLSEPRRAMINPTPHGAQGLEVDKFDETLVSRTLDLSMGRVVKEAGPLAGKTLQGIVHDSFEAGLQTWSPRTVELFRRNRGL